MSSDQIDSHFNPAHKGYQHFVSFMPRAIMNIRKIFYSPRFNNCEGYEPSLFIPRERNSFASPTVGQNEPPSSPRQGSMCIDHVFSTLIKKETRAETPPSCNHSTLNLNVLGSPFWEKKTSTSPSFFRNLRTFDACWRLPSAMTTTFWPSGRLKVMVELGSHSTMRALRRER